MCTQHTQFYELSVHQWIKLMDLRQNRDYMEMMLRRLQLRLTSRLSRPVAQQVPLYALLLKRANHLIQQAENESRQVGSASQLMCTTTGYRFFAGEAVNQ